MTKRTKTQFIVVRNGEHLDVCNTAEEAARRIEEIKQNDWLLCRGGWMRVTPDQISYYILPR